MTYVITENCIRCKYTDCVEVCPVNCFYAGNNMLVINPDECIDCGVCEPECPVGAIKPESKELSEWVTINKKYAAIFPNITKMLKERPFGEEHEGEANKKEKYLGEND